MTREELLTALLEQAPTSLAYLEGPELRMVIANQHVRATPAGPGMVGKTVREMFPAGHPIRGVIERVYATGVAETLTATPPQFPDGTLADRFFTRTYAPLRGHDGAVHGVLVHGYDVTEEVRAREARDRLAERCRAEHERLIALLEEAPVLIVLLEVPALRIAMLNRRARESFGGRDMVGVSVREMVPGDDVTLAAVERVYATGVAETLDRDARMAGFEGRSFTSTVAPIRDHDGVITALMVATVETTDQLRARHVLEDQARHLELARLQAVEADHAKDQFLAMLGHELRNPLAPMVTALQVMRLRGVNLPEQDLLERQVAHVNRLVDDLLDISRIARGVVVLNKRPVDLAAIVDRALEMTGPILVQRAHRVERATAHGLVVSGDPDRLAQVAANLITNAAKYSDRGSRIRVETDRVGPTARLSVADDGVGIAPEMLHTIFDAFVQQPQTLERSRGGLGLGLAIVRSLIDGHGGTVTAHSEGPGKGSTFVVELPAFESRELADAAGAGRVATGGVPRRILIVDDNWEAADILRVALEAVGHTIEIAYDSPTALATARSFRPELGLLDIGLPEIDGYRLASLLRADREFPLVAVTGYGQPRDRERALSSGFAAHLIKPVDLHELARLVDDLCAASAR